MTRLEGEDRHAELFPPVLRVDAPEREETVVGQAKRIADRAEVLFDQFRMETIVARWYRRVRREHHVR